MEDKSYVVTKALLKAYSLGRKYASQADSEYETHEQFKQLVQEMQETILCEWTTQSKES